jgi:hypothetical protein
MGLLCFFAASFLTFVLASGASVYLAGQVEHAWGPAGSFQVLCLLSLVAALMLLVGFGIGAAILRRWPGPARAALLGVACAGVFAALILAASALGADPAQSWLLLVCLPLLGALSPVLGPKRTADPSLSSQNP